MKKEVILKAVVALSLLMALLTGTSDESTERNLTAMAFVWIAIMAAVVLHTARQCHEIENEQ